MYTKIMVMVSALGGSIGGGILGVVLGQLPEIGYTQHYLLLCTAILLGTLIAFGLALYRKVPAFLIVPTVGGIIWVALTISALATGVYIGPLEPFVPFQPYSRSLFGWLPYIPYIAPAFAAILVTAFIPFEKAMLKENREI